MYDTYFGVLVDVALGGPNDDYVGCDVSRGLGYAYNGYDFDADELGYKGYGENPPAVGVDFFEGPYQDNDDFDNPLTTDINLAISQKGIPYPGLGIGYNDEVIDNERFGMRRFLYYNNTGGNGNSNQTDPINAIDYYSYLTGYWKDGSRFVYGGSGHNLDNNANPNVFADFMFPGDSDPLGWGTGGVAQDPWTEESSGNIPFDRRFSQSSGTFTLRTGAVNNITVGVVWARTVSGGPFESVKKLFAADDKAQALFDNCFKILEGPHAPNLEIQELENALILTINNPPGSNNEGEAYKELDPEITNPGGIDNLDKFYRFQGYQIYQIVSKEVSTTDLQNTNKARLAFQCDIEDDVAKLINYTFNSDVGAASPIVEVDGKNIGLQHSFLATEDLFALGDKKLVNFKEYYYMVVAYAHNNYQTYVVDDPGSIDGQKRPYLSSRKAAFGEIKPHLGIPHTPAVEAGGTTFGTYYGWSPKIKQIEGIGNGGRNLDLSQASTNAILDKGEIDIVEYESGAGPIDIKVIDPLNLKPGDYEIIFNKDVDEFVGGVVDSTRWTITRTFNGLTESIESNVSIKLSNEQLIPEWGISVTIKQIKYLFDESSPAITNAWRTSPIGASATPLDSSKNWLAGMQDSDVNFTNNWIRAGSNVPPVDPDPSCSPALWTSNPCYYYDKQYNEIVLDPTQAWEKLLSGTITSYRYLGHEVFGMPLGAPGSTPGSSSGYFGSGLNSTLSTFKIENMHDVDILITNDQSKWTKCVVIEMNTNENQTVGGSDVLEIRNQASVDKSGNPIEGETGMGWFPGYAINVNTGQRLNMAFAENSWLQGDNGNDMIWNPTSSTVNSTNEPLFGGMHYIYVFNAVNDMPIYDNGTYIYDKLSLKTNAGHRAVFRTCTWVAAPLLIEGRTILETDITIKARVNKPYSIREENKGINKGRPRYSFSITENDMVRTSISTELESKLDIINIVPNPYYAYSQYERSRLDNVVKITNLPERCKVKIFNMQGALIRQYDKDDPITSLDWDLTNSRAIPISGGVYIIHIEVPDVGEKVLKWFGVMRQQDFENL